MNARQLIEGSAFGPEQVKLMCQAFDEAWVSIAGNFQSPLAVESGRLRLANAILTAAKLNCTDADALKREGLQLMASAYRDDKISS